MTLLRANEDALNSQDERVSAHAALTAASDPSQNRQDGEIA